MSSENTSRARSTARKLTNVGSSVKSTVVGTIRRDGPAEVLSASLFDDQSFPVVTNDLVAVEEAAVEAVSEYRVRVEFLDADGDHLDDVEMDAYAFAQLVDDDRKIVVDTDVDFGV